MTIEALTFSNRYFHEISGIVACERLSRLDIWGNSIHPRAGRARARLEGKSAASEYKESVARPVVRRRKTVPTPTSPSLFDSDDPALSLETVLVEDERVSLEGVGRVDREAASSSFSWGRAGTLAAGDLAALVICQFCQLLSLQLPLLHPSRLNQRLYFLLRRASRVNLFSWVKLL